MKGAGKPGKIKRTDELLRESADKYRFLIDATSTGYVILDDRGRVVDANLEYVRMTGRGGLGEILGKPVTDWTAPHDLERNAAEVGKCLATGSVRNLEIDYVGPDGAFVPLELNATVLPGPPVRIFTVCRDISERKGAEEALRVSESRARSIIESIPMGMLQYRLEPDGRLVFAGANPAADRLLGVDNRRFVGKTIEEAFPPLAATEVPHKYREVVKTGAKWRTESIEYQDDLIKGAFAVQAFRTGPDTMVAAFENITERKRVEFALKESEAKFRRLYNETPVLLHSIDQRGVLLDVNDFWLETMGYGREEVIGRDVTDFYTEASRKYAREVVQPDFFAKGNAKDVAYQLVKKSGEVIDVLLSATGERDAEGRVVRSRAVIADVTERRRAEDALHKSEARYRLLYEGTPVMMHSISSEGKLISVSNHWLETLGYTREEVLGRPSTEFLDEQSRAYAQTVVLPEYMRTGVCTDIPYMFVTKSGARVSTLLSAIAERDQSGKVVRSLAVIIDVTKRQQAERALRASEERFRDLAESLPLTVFELDLQGRFTYVNRAALETFGYTPEDVATGLTMPQVLAAADRARARATMGRRLAGVETGYNEYQGLRKDGTTFPMAVASNAILRDGRPLGLRGIVLDLTERKALEAERMKTDKLESIGMLAGGIAHDFNNLLQGVFGYISLTKLEIDDREKALAKLEQTEKALHNAVSLAAQLLTFSKGGKPVKELIDLGPVIENACRFSLSGSRTGCRLALDDDLWSVEADEGQVAQVIQNMVLNADQAMPNGGTVEIAAKNVRAGDPGLPAGLAPGRYVQLSIADGGIGIPPEYLTKIFDPYFTTKEKGSGLGLAMCYSIARNHGGLITVRSARGTGSTFTVYLPASEERARKAQVQPAPVPAPSRRGRVLVMDDDAVVLTVAGELLRALGHEAQLTAHGEQAVERYRESLAAGRPFDVVILDLTVRGGLGGQETARRLREIDPGVKAVVSSGYSDDEVTSSFREHGFRAFLKKPYRLEELKSTLNALLD